MRYLHRREDFLIRDIKLDVDDIDSYISTSGLINEEVGENQITWGGSLIGRFFNSAIRMIKIGFKLVEIPPLLDKLEAELSYMQTEFMKQEDKKLVETLMLKNQLMAIKDESLKPSDGQPNDERKILKELLGDYQNRINDLYDPDDPQKGKKTEALLQGVMTFLRENQKSLEEILKEDNYKVIQDMLSDYNDALRKYWWKIENPMGDTGGSGVSSNLQRINTNFGNVIQVINSLRQQSTTTTSTF